jgi:hypothetical protein
MAWSGFGSGFDLVKVENIEKKLEKDNYIDIRKAKKQELSTISNDDGPVTLKTPLKPQDSLLKQIQITEIKKPEAKNDWWDEMDDSEENLNQKIKRKKSKSSESDSDSPSDSLSSTSSSSSSSLSSSSSSKKKKKHKHHHKHKHKKHKHHKKQNKNKKKKKEEEEIENEEEIEEELKLTEEENDRVAQEPTLRAQHLMRKEILKKKEEDRKMQKKSKEMAKPTYKPTHFGRKFSDYDYHPFDRERYMFMYMLYWL